MIVKLEAVNALAQVIAAIGVIVSLFYLAAQIWQNTRSMRVLSIRSTQVNTPVAQSRRET